MNYGLQISASGVLTSMHRQDVLANNLANITTTGFKEDLVTFRARAVVRDEDGVRHLPSNRMLEQLGAGVLVEPTRTSFEQGTIETTDNALDVAIRGEGFLVVQHAEGARDGMLRLTRDGRMTLDERGRLVRSTDGMLVLDSRDRPIRVDRDRPVEITTEGEVVQDGGVVARLGLVTVQDETALIKQGGNVWGVTEGNRGLVRAGRVRLQPRAIEASAVDPIRAMMGITSAGHAVAGNARMIEMQDRMTGLAINTLGRVS